MILKLGDISNRMGTGPDFVRSVEVETRCLTRQDAHRALDQVLDLAGVTEGGPYCAYGGSEPGHPMDANAKVKA